MTNKSHSPKFDPARSAAIESLVTKVAQTGTPENQHFQNTKGKRILLSGVAIALLATGGALVMQMPVTDKSSIACLARAELHGNNFPGTTMVLGVPSTAERPDSTIMIEDALSLCRAAWAQNAIDPNDPDGRAHPSLYDPSSSHPVPSPLTVCVLQDGRAAVIPGDERVCGTLGLALKTDPEPSP